MFNNLRFPLLNSIPEVVYQLDQYVREDIAKGYIAGERDYVSTLMAYIRLFLCGIYKVESLYANVDSRVLNQSYEQKFGCDSMIIFRVGDEAKICMFEAKYPRLTNSRSSWDKFQSYKKSHFHDQLTRQSHWSEMVTMWELFINDSPLESLEYDKYGSTCIWHKDAFDYSEKHIDTQKIVWNNEKLQECLRENLKNNQGKALNLQDILSDILDFANKEKINNVKKNSVHLTSTEGENIPIPVSSIEVGEHIREARYLLETNTVENRDRDRKNIFLSLGFTNVLFIQIHKDDISQNTRLEDLNLVSFILESYGYFKLKPEQFIQEMQKFHIDANLPIDELLERVLKAI